MKLIFLRIKSKDIFAVLVYFICIFLGFFLVNKTFRETYLFYFLIITISLILTLFAEYSLNPRLSIISYFISILLLFSIMAFRAQTGKDDFVYRRIFLSAQGCSLPEFFKLNSVELGYEFITYILYYLCAGNYNLFQAIITFITGFFWAKALWNERNNLSITIGIYILITNYYFLMMSAGLIRMFLAAGIVFWSYHFINTGEIRKFFAGIIFAASFHLSSLFMLIFIIVFFNRDSVYHYWKRILISMFTIVPVIIYLAGRFILPRMGMRYAIYSFAGGLSLLSFIDVLPIFLLGLFIENYFGEDTRYTYNLSMILVGLSMIVEVFASAFSFGRLVYFTNIGIIILLASADKLSDTENNGLRFVIPTISILYGFIYLLHTAFLNPAINSTLFPYKSFW